MLPFLFVHFTVTYGSYLRPSTSDCIQRVRRGIQWSSGAVAWVAAVVSWWAEMQRARAAVESVDFGSWLFGIPWVTRNVLFLCVGVYFVVFSLSNVAWVARAGCVGYAPLMQLELYRVITSPFLHAGAMHLLFNMLAWCRLTVEGQLSSGVFLQLLILSVVLSAAAQCAMGAFLSLVPALGMSSCSVGLSGVIFTMIVVETHLGGPGAVRLFNMFDLPAHLYPWTLLIVAQLMIPNASLSGHLCGLVVGVLYVRGYLSGLFFRFPAIRLPLNGWIDKHEAHSVGPDDMAVDEELEPDASEAAVEGESISAALRVLSEMGFERTQVCTLVIFAICVSS
jgi:membrane associated rhomboid family serine protease